MTHALGSIATYDPPPTQQARHVSRKVLDDAHRQELVAYIERTTDGLVTGADVAGVMFDPGADRGLPGEVGLLYLQVYVGLSSQLGKTLVVHSRDGGDLVTVDVCGYVREAPPMSDDWDDGVWPDAVVAPSAQRDGEIIRHAPTLSGFSPSTPAPPGDTYPPSVVDEEGTTYTPWRTSTGMVGFECQAAGDDKGGWPAPSYLYLNPSSDSDDGSSTVFIYYGTEGDPAQDAALMHVDVVEREAPDTRDHDG